MTALIVDASVAIGWFVTEIRSAEAERFLSPPYQRIAPDLLALEVANGLWKYERRGLIDARQRSAALEALTRFVDMRSLTQPDLFAASNLAAQHNHPVYDCLYLALAMREGAALATFDARMIALAKSVGVEVI